MIKKIDKPWGHEEIWALTDKYVGKILHIYKGESLSVQHHEVKDETIYVLEGSVEVLLIDSPDDYGTDKEERVNLFKGESLRIPPGKIHQFSAPNESVELMEVSTPELDDVVRHFDKYGRAPKK